MKPPPTGEVGALRRRLVIMVAINVACAIVAVGSIIGNLAFHVPWMLWTFGAALLFGFGAQIWMIVGFARQGRDQNPGQGGGGGRT